MAVLENVEEYVTTVRESSSSRRFSSHTHTHTHNFFLASEHVRTHTHTRERWIHIDTLWGANQQKRASQKRQKQDHLLVATTKPSMVVVERMPSTMAMNKAVTSWPTF